MPGVLSTRAGWIGSIEVAEVRFDRSLMRYEDLLERARDRDCARPIFARSDRQFAIAKQVPELSVERSDAEVRGVADDKYYLEQTPLRFVPMTSLQRTRINAKVEDRDRWLSPRQLELLALVELDPRADWPMPIGQDLRADFERIASFLAERGLEPGARRE